MPQPHRKVTVRWPYGRLAMTVRWHTVFTLSWAPRKSYGSLTVSLRRPHGALTAAVRQTSNSCKSREVAARSPPGLLAVTLRFLISWIVRSPCGRRNICEHNYRRPQDLTIFNNHVFQTVDRRTVRRPYGGSIICDRGISHRLFDLCHSSNRFVHKKKCRLSSQRGKLPIPIFVCQPHNKLSNVNHIFIKENHADVIKWKHFPRYWPFVRGIHRSSVNSPHKGQWRGALMFTLICARINDWVNNREAGDLRRQHGHYDVIVIKLSNVNHIFIKENAVNPVRTT